METNKLTSSRKDGLTTTTLLYNKGTLRIAEKFK